MPRKYEDKGVRVVEQRICVETTCDNCGKKADRPEEPYWEWGSVGIAYGHVQRWKMIDGDTLDDDDYWLCPDCMDRLAELIERKEI